MEPNCGWNTAPASAKLPFDGWQLNSSVTEGELYVRRVPGDTRFQAPARERNRPLRVLAGEADYGVASSAQTSKVPAVSTTRTRVAARPFSVNATTEPISSTPVPTENLRGRPVMGTV